MFELNESRQVIYFKNVNRRMQLSLPLSKMSDCRIVVIDVKVMKRAVGVLL